MGLEISAIIAGISAIAGVVGTVASVSAASSSAKAQEEARDIRGAQNKIEGIVSRRQRIREARIRRAQILAASENSGTGQSSGEFGGVGALSTNLSGLVSAASGASKSNAGVNKQNQRAANFDFQAQAISTLTDGVRTGLGTFRTIFDQD